jgi:hypothetical protein|tara:strand:+ start:396 stop:644 length:249 start_codon:yes stop_codon:yes gene_type:complete
LAKPFDEINEQFIDIINQEDWDFASFPVEEETIVEIIPIVRPEIETGDIPLGTYIIPTPIPNVFLNISLGFDLQQGDEDARW